MYSTIYPLVVSTLAPDGAASVVPDPKSEVLRATILCLINLPYLNVGSHGSKNRAHKWSTQSIVMGLKPESLIHRAAVSALHSATIQFSGLSLVESRWNQGLKYLVITS